MDVDRIFQKKAEGIDEHFHTVVTDVAMPEVHHEKWWTMADAERKK